MVNFPSTNAYLKLAGAAAVVAFLVFHWFGDQRAALKLQQAETKLEQVSKDLAVTKEQLVVVTRTRDELTDKLDQASKDVEKIQENLDVTLSFLAKQKPPADCTKLGKWLVDNKGDLKWEK